MEQEKIIETEENKLNSNDWIEIFLIGLMFVIKVTPQLQYSFTGLRWSLAYHVVFALWVLITMCRCSNWLLGTRELQRTFFWLIYLFVTFVFFENTQWGYFSLLLSFWEPAIIFYYYTQFDDNAKKREIIAWIAVIALAYGLINSIQSVNANELAAREASSGHTSEDAVLTGNYSFTATLTILWGAMICFIQKFKFQTKKIRCAIASWMAVGSIIFIFRCNLMISILCIILSVVLYFTINSKREFNIQRLLIIALVVVGVALLWNSAGSVLADVVDALGSLIGSDTITSRTALISAWLRGGDMEGNLESRFELCRIALNAFINNPIFGIGPQNNAGIYFKTYLGLHATFFDEWARFGVVGMAFEISTFAVFYRYVCQIIDEGRTLRAFKAGFWIFIIISMLNPVASANVGIALLYIVPTFALMKNDREIIGYE